MKLKNKDKEFGAYHFKQFSRVGNGRSLRTWSRPLTTSLSCYYSSLVISPVAAGVVFLLSEDETAEEIPQKIQSLYRRRRRRRNKKKKLVRARSMMNVRRFGFDSNMATLNSGSSMGISSSILIYSILV